MPLTLTPTQQNFMKNGDDVRSLAEWVLRCDNHIAADVRAEAGLSRRAVAAATRRDTQHMMDHLSSGRTSVSNLVHLINGFNFYNQAK